VVSIYTFPEYPWQEVFAWFPVKTINGKQIWLKKVYMRKVWLMDFHMEPIYQYATLFDLLANAD
jgi:hypothetical protein